VNPDGTRLLIRHGPRENRVRPAIDALFRSAAAACRPRGVAIVLTGLLDDGTAGLRAVKARRRCSVVPDPADAAWPDMPRNALRGDSPDRCAPLAEVPALLARLTRPPADARPALPPRLAAEARIAEG
jgi:two-component system chemotaxis response regulator CheB